MPQSQYTVPPARTKQQQPSFDSFSTILGDTGCKSFRFFFSGLAAYVGVHPRSLNYETHRDCKTDLFSGGLLQPCLPCGCALHSTRHGEPSTTSLDSAFSEHIHQAYTSTRLKQKLCLTFISEQMHFTMYS